MKALFITLIICYAVLCYLWRKEEGIKDTGVEKLSNDPEINQQLFRKTMKALDLILLPYQVPTFFLVVYAIVDFLI